MSVQRTLKLVIKMHIFITFLFYFLHRYENAKINDFNRRWVQTVGEYPLCDIRDVPHN